MIIISLKDKNFIRILIASFTLIIGGLIYVIFRTDNLIMFSWFDELGLSENISFLRGAYGEYSLYSWVKYSVPAALWLFAYLYIIDAIWDKFHTSILYKIFFWLMPIVSILSEFLQLFHILPGTFDVIDVCAYVAAVAIYFIIHKL